MGTFCNPAGHQQPGGSRLLSYPYEPMIEIIGLFKNADIIITANPAVSCARMEVKDRNLFWSLPREGGGSPPACGESRFWLRREMHETGCRGHFAPGDGWGCEVKVAWWLSPKRKAEMVSLPPA